MWAYDENVFISFSVECKDLDKIFEASNIIVFNTLFIFSIVAQEMFEMDK